MANPLQPLGSLPPATGGDLLAALNNTIRRLGTVNALLMPFTVQPPPVTVPALVPTQQWIQTWNTSTQQTALLLNVTDTSSPAGSLLLDLQVGGVSKFSVRKDGTVNITLPVGVTTLTINPGPLIVGTDPGGTDIVRIGGNIMLPLGNYITFGGIAQSYMQVEATPRFVWSLGGTTRMHLTTTTLNPATAGGLSLGSASLPWNNVAGRAVLVYDTSGNLRANLSDSGGNTGFEMGRIDGTAASAFMDFHSGATAVDYDSRLSATGGSGVAGGGQLTLTAAGFTVTGTSALNNTVTIGTNALAGALALNAPTPTGGSIASTLGFFSAGVLRWQVRIDVDEAGADTGSTWNLLARTDAGGIIDRPIQIVRAAAGLMSLSRPVTVAGLLTASGALSIAGNLTMTTAASRLVPGATSFAVRNNANSADNLLITNNGKLTAAMAAPYTGAAAEVVIAGLSLVRDVLGGDVGSTFGYGVQFAVRDSVASASQHVGGLQVMGQADVTGNYHEIIGTHSYAYSQATGTVDLAIGVYAHAVAGSGTTLSGVAIEATPVKGGGTFTEAIGVAIGYHATHTPGTDFDAVGTNQYGVRVGPVKNGTLNYAWYSEDGKLRFGDTVVFGPAASRIVGGATSLSLRNAADSADNVLVADAGEVTLRNQLKFTAGNPTSLGTTDNFGLSLKTNALVRWSIESDAVADLIADTTNGGAVVYRAGASSVGAKAAGILFSSDNASTTSTTTATLTGGSNGGTYTLKANTLNADGDTLRITYLGYMSATTGTFTLTVGGATIIGALALSSNGTFATTVWITRRDATHIDWTYTGLHFNAANVTDLNRTNNVAVTLTSDQTINFQGSAAAGTFTAHLCQIALEAA